MSALASSTRGAAAALGTVLAIGSLSACGGESEKSVIAAIDVRADAVQTVTFVGKGLSATLRADSGSWLPGPGATVQAATMLSTATDRYFPLNSYRILEGVDPNRPEFGFAAGSRSTVEECTPECSLTVVTTAGRTLKLKIGNPTFNGGFYAKLDDDPRIFLITKDTVAGIISEALGKDFAFPASAQIRNIDRTLAGENEDGTKKTDQPVYDPYLRQVLAAEAAEKEQDEQKSARILVKAAGSTQDQPGAKEGKEVRTNSEALTPTGATQ
ncbi:MAG: hypothetical protein ACT4QG_21790 [Sporichthyaceae bacterium]